MIATADKISIDEVVFSVFDLFALRHFVGFVGKSLQFQKSGNIIYCKYVVCSGCGIFTRLSGQKS